jgi:hypothetical protein
MKILTSKSGKIVNIVFKFDNVLIIEYNSMYYLFESSEINRTCFCCGCYTNSEINSIDMEIDQVLESKWDKLSNNIDDCILMLFTKIYNNPEYNYNSINNIIADYQEYSNYMTMKVEFIDYEDKLKTLSLLSTLINLSTDKLEIIDYLQTINSDLDVDSNNYLQIDNEQILNKINYIEL